MDENEQLSILFVDDLLNEVKPYSDFMAREGWRSKCVPSGEECLELLRQGERWKVIAMDAQMKPGMLHGRGALRAILRELPEQCVVFLSGKEVYADHAISALQDGAIDYVQKGSVDMPEFIERMKQAIDVCNERSKNKQTKGVLAIAKAIFHQALPRIQAAYLRTEAVESASSKEEILDQISKIRANLEHAEKYLRRLTEFDPRAIHESVETTDLRAEARKGVESIEQLFELKLDKPSVLAFTGPEEGSEAKIRFDSRWALLITEILVQNAAEAVLASESEKKEVKVRVQENPENPAQWSLIVEDTGTGVPEEVRSKLGEPGISTKRGMGMGLYLVTEVVGRENIEIGDLAPGTRMTVHFPKA